MLAPRWRKVLADLWANKVRTLLAVLSIAAGVQVVGTITTSYVIISRDMNASFLEIDPAGGVMSTSDFDAAFLAELQALPGVDRLEARAVRSGFKLEKPGLPATGMTLNGIADFESIRLDRPILDAGAWPAAGEIALERNGLAAVDVSLGDAVTVSGPDGQQQTVRVTGFVEDRTVNSTQAGLRGYATLATLGQLGATPQFNSLGYTVAEQAADKAHVQAVGQTLAAYFAAHGGSVATTLVREPGQHPAAQQATAILALLGVMALLTVLLSAFLVTNVVAALMAQQVRHIGVMKAIGARTSQIIGMYTILLLCLGLPALLMAAPLGLLAGYAGAGTIARFLNFRIGAFRVEFLPLLVMTFLSLGVPVVAGLVPVRRGARTTIREALTGYGLSAGGRRRERDGGDERTLGLPRPLLISLRNTARRKSRLLLTLTTLVLAGAIFIGVSSAQTSMDAGLTQMYRYYLADVNVDFAESQPADDMQALLQGVPGVAQVESWIFASGEPAQTEGGTAERITIAAPPLDSEIVARDVESGRWLQSGQQNEIVMCTRSMRLHPEWNVGDTVRLTLNSSTDADFVIVGTFPFASGEGNQMAIASYADVSRLLGESGRASNFRLRTSPADAATQDRVRDEISALLADRGAAVEVRSGHTTADALNTILHTIVLFLLMVAVLVAVVGALGLTGTMSINVMERTREIGVLRAIGASNAAVLQLVLVEGLLIGLLSWLVGLVLAAPIGVLLARILGQGLFDVTFAFEPAWTSTLIWLALVAVLAILASALPARHASRLTVREALAYE